MHSHSWNDPYMVRTRRSFFKALFITIGIFLLLFVLSHISGVLYTSFLAVKSSDALLGGIAKDTAYLKNQGDAVAKNSLLKEYLIAGDFEKLLEVMQKEKADRFIGLMGLANKDGVIVSRTKSTKRLGDNVFLTMPQGRIVSTGKSVESIEISGVDPTQLLMTTARPVIKDGMTIGALFANYLMDDAYATRFRDTYLPHGSEVVFYTKNFGVYGNSFSDPSTHKLINSYFNSGSEWIVTENSGKTISLKNNGYYIVHNVVFPGLEQSPGGAIIFIPRKDISGTVNIGISLLTLCVFICFALRYHLRSRGEERSWRYYVLLVIVAIPVLALSLCAFYAQNSGFLKLERIPYILYNSTIRLQPESGIYDMDFDQRMSVIVDTGDESINAVQVELVFDPEAVLIKSLNTDASACSYVIENTIDQKAGRARLNCVVLHPEVGRQSIKIAEAIVHPKHKGTFSLSFDPEETKVLANDGLGTNVLRMAQAGSYRVDDFDLSEPSSDKTTNGRTFVVFSPSHPNESRWYNSRTARFVWRGKPEAVYSYAFDTSPDTVPSKNHTTQGSKIEIPIPGDGIFYFHLQLAGGGPIAHYRVQTDLTPPSIVSMKLSSDKIVVGDVVRFSFDAEDAASGVQRNYYVDLGNHLFLPVGSELFIPFLEDGDQNVTLRVYDDAGNYTERSDTVHVNSM